MTHAKPRPTQIRKAIAGTDAPDLATAIRDTTAPDPGPGDPGPPRTTGSGERGPPGGPPDGDRGPTEGRGTAPGSETGLQEGNLQAPRIVIRTGDKTLILGAYKVGKTTLARYLLKACPRWLAWDPTHAFPTPQGGASWSRWGDVERWYRTYGRAAYQPHRSRWDGELEAEFARFCDYALRQSNAMVFIDEPTMVGKMPQSFWDLHRLGHKRGLGLIIATHRLTDLQALVQNVDHMFVFRTPVVYDQWTFKSVLGDQGAAFVANCRKYEFWYRGNATDGRIQAGPCPPIPLK